jgi:hypothetical protein
MNCVAYTARLARAFAGACLRSRDVGGKLAPGGAAAMALALGFALPSSAAIITATTTGILTSGYDTTGVFGPHLTDLTGAKYKLIFTFDTSVGQLLKTPSSSTLRGGATTGSYVSPGTALLQINGGQYLIPNDNYSVDIANAGVNTLQSVDYQGFDSSGLQIDDSATQEADGVGFSGDLIPPPAGNLCALAKCTSSFGIFEVVPASGYLLNYAQGVLQPRTYYITSAPGDVPEPATWAMMLVGFAALGAALRRSCGKLRDEIGDAHDVFVGVIA